MEKITVASVKLPCISLLYDIAESTCNKLPQAPPAKANPLHRNRRCITNHFIAMHKSALGFLIGCKHSYFSTSARGLICFCCFAFNFSALKLKSLPFNRRRRYYHCPPPLIGTRRQHPLSVQYEQLLIVAPLPKPRSNISATQKPDLATSFSTYREARRKAVDLRRPNGRRGADSRYVCNQEN